MKVGGALAIVGGFGYFITLLLHGDLPDHTTEAALSHIAARPEWRALKLALIVSVTCWIGAFCDLARTLSDGLTGLLTRWALSLAVVGLSVVIVEYAIIGHALKEVADTWQENGSQEQIDVGAIMLSISAGLFHAFVGWMLGLPFVLIGIAVALSDSFPRWLGWPAVFAGSGAFIAGTTRFLGIELVPYPLLFGGFVLPLNLWMVALGVIMSRSSCSHR